MLATRTARAVAHRIPRIPQQVAELAEPGLSADTALRVLGARVVFADAAQLLEDLPEVPQGPRKLAAWLLHHAAIVSVTQAAQQRVNDPIPTWGKPLPAVRLPRGGRTLCVPLQPRGLLALKGVGVAPGVEPAPGVLAHADGLLALNKAFEEVLHQRLVEATLRHAGSPVRVLPIYAVLDLGFDLLRENGRRCPAAVLVRRAHRRPLGGVEMPAHGSPQQALCLEIEVLLRRYGITSTTPGTTYELHRTSDGSFSYRMESKRVEHLPHAQAQVVWSAYRPADAPPTGVLRFAGINVQCTRWERVEEAELLDFGSYWVRDRFEEPLLSRVRDRSSHWGGTIRVDSSHFVQPDPRLAVCARAWQVRRVSRRELVQLGCADAPLALGDERPNAETATTIPMEQLCRQLASDFRAGRRTGAQVDAVIGAFVARLTAHWP